MKKRKWRRLSILLAFMLLLGCLPTASFGAAATDGLYAADTIDVTFYLYGGTGGYVVANRTVVAGAPLNGFPSPLKDGYRLAGWYTEMDGKGERVTENSSFTKDVTIYAYWIPESEYVEDEGNQSGGSESGGNSNSGGGNPGGSENNSGNGSGNTSSGENNGGSTETGNNSGGNPNGGSGSTEGGGTNNGGDDGSDGQQSINIQKLRPLTEAEIRQRWAIADRKGAVAYAENPVTQAPYSAGVLSDKTLNQGMEYINFARRLAGLNEVKMDRTMNDFAQHGSALLAAIDELTHTPAKPADMGESFFAKGYNGTSTSNIAWNYANLAWATQGYLNDDIGSANISSVGHRRWVLSSRMQNVGMGFAGRYSCLKVFDLSASAYYFDYIAWPAEGSFPTDMFGTKVSWSVTPDWKLYKASSVNDLTVTITRQSDNKVWNLSSKTHGSNGDLTNGFLRLDSNPIGDGKSIVFHMGTANLGASTYAGKYDVQIAGLQDLNGKSTTIAYTVDFFTIEEYTPITTPGSGGSNEGGTTTTPPTLDNNGSYLNLNNGGQSVTTTENTTTTTTGNTSAGFQDVKEGSWYYNAVTDVVKEGLFSGLSETRFGPEDNMTRAMYVTVLGRLAEAQGRTTTGYRSSFRDVEANSWYSQYVAWAASESIVEGYNANSFGPEDPITREQIASLTVRFCDYIDLELLNSVWYNFRDLEQISRWAYADVERAVGARFMQGNKEYYFKPLDNATRAEVATVIRKLYGDIDWANRLNRTNR